MLLLSFDVCDLVFAESLLLFEFCRHAHARSLLASDQLLNRVSSGDEMADDRNGFGESLNDAGGAEFAVAELEGKLGGTPGGGFESSRDEIHAGDRTSADGNLPEISERGFLARCLFE